ncbi:unnamed protein product [Dicrocoelium dendriticum]|nr:unnamed protein product [Dicrocoelium dendriticum]
MLYLEDSQPRGLQQASEHSLGVLWYTDAGLVWTLLSEQFPPDYTTSRFRVPPSPELFPLKMQLPSEHNRLRINPDRLGDILSRLCPYISIKTPDASEHSLGVLWYTDAGLVWTLLLEQFPPDYTTSRFRVPPSPELFPLKMKLPSEHNRLRINPDRLGDILSRLCPYISIKTPDV